MPTHRELALIRLCLARASPARGAPAALRTPAARNLDATRPPAHSVYEMQMVRSCHRARKKHAHSSSAAAWHSWRAFRPPLRPLPCPAPPCRHPNRPPAIMSAECYNWVSALHGCLAWEGAPTHPPAVEPSPSAHRDATRCSAVPLPTHPPPAPSPERHPGRSRARLQERPVLLLPGQPCAQRGARLGHRRGEHPRAHDDARRPARLPCTPHSGRRSCLCHPVPPHPRCCLCCSCAPGAPSRLAPAPCHSHSFPQPFARCLLAHAPPARPSARCSRC